MINYNDLIGLPFDDDNINGYNCYEILRKVYLKHGIFIPDVNVSLCSCKEYTDQEVHKQIKYSWKRIDKPKELCGVLINSYGQRFANHIATYIKKNTIIHTSREHGCIIEKLMPKFKNRVMGYYQFIGVG